MSMAELLKLVKSYANGDIDYPAFRRDFVKRFLATRNSDFSVDCAIVQIESLCADVAEGEISSESDFQNKMKAIAEPTRADSLGPNPVQIVEVSVGVYQSISSGSTSVGANVLQAAA
jgi:hypothetical protein